MLEDAGVDLRLHWVEMAKVRGLALCSPFQSVGFHVARCIRLESQLALLVMLWSCVYIHPGNNIT